MSYVPLCPLCLIPLTVSLPSGSSVLSDEDHVQWSEEKLSNLLLSESYTVTSNCSGAPLWIGNYTDERVEHNYMSNSLVSKCKGIMVQYILCTSLMHKNCSCFWNTPINLHLDLKYGFVGTWTWNRTRDR